MCKICNGIKEMVSYFGNQSHEYEIVKCECVGGPKFTGNQKDGFYVVADIKRREELMEMDHYMPEPDAFFPNTKGLLDPSIQVKYDEYFAKISRVRGVKPLPIKEWAKLLNQRGF